MGLPFYGLTLQYKQDLHETLLRLSLNTEGFSYETWYTMPVYLRNYYLRVISDIKKEKAPPPPPPKNRR